ncbi:methyltransferase family protein [Mesorhizobium australicum]|uniref:Protein-S-isoprenylcysteine O-methyltransferase Ste14 n=1 Tax=Mesorhizobium australicum TaxID=536018 RepID=A0A1X7PDQ5_9HYPH|nr:isoprenylcysteine carboxylmethyltransferase family protein [Mesorhizobium australicum]SMH48874.1 Protein-S-isoprenylcysteine O-methyltransferase Ste14 [Mesorhizobium australicum]
MIPDIIATQGNWLFRWRSYILLAFIPLGAWAISTQEPIEANYGEMADRAWELSCIALAFLGLAVRVLTIGHTPSGTSGRNTREQIAETLNTTGMYSITRNPLYLGNAITYVAIALFTQSLAFTLIMALFLVIYLERIIATEEKFLAAKFGTEYRAWTDRVPVFFPKFSLWTAPNLPFSFRNVLRREYSGFFAIIVAVVAINYAHEAFGEGEIRIGISWAAFLFVGTAVYLALRSLKKHTDILKVEGR